VELGQGGTRAWQRAANGQGRARQAAPVCAVCLQSRPPSRAVVASHELAAPREGAVGGAAPVRGWRLQKSSRPR
jgi:hypothetical protein